MTGRNSPETASANEEIQSNNEELRSINEELLRRNEQLSRAIDEQKRIELELRASEEKYRLLVDGARDLAIIGLDPDGRVSMWNLGAERLLGFAEAEILGAPLHRFFTPEDVAAGRPEHELEEARRNLAAEDATWLVRKDGSRFWAEGSLTALYDEAGSLAGYSRVVKNVDERKRAEDALRESEERFRLLADHAPVLIWLNGPEGCEYVNRAYLEFLGIEERQVRGYDWAPYVHPDDRADYLARYHQAYERRQRFEATCRFLRHDGEHRWMQAVGLPRLTPDGEMLGYVGSSLDIDDMKRAEGALRDADRHKNEFLAILAHELRNPLAPLRNALEILRVRPDDLESAAVGREVIERQVRMLTRMVDDLLDVSRIARGKIALKPELIDLRSAVHLAVESVQYQVGAKGHRLVLEVPEEPLQVEGDLVRLEQVFANLLGNAVKYTDGGGEITLSMAREGKEVVVGVRDTGIGIAAELLPRIFDLYIQGDTTVQREGGGLGIGLSLVRQLIELHKGSVTAKSEGPGHGTAIEVRLPLLSQAQYRKARWTDTGKDVAVPMPLVSRVLVVDDNVDAAETLARLLRLFGPEVEVAYSGASALEIAATFRPEVVLLDIGMPQMDGYEVARRLREGDGNENMALVALSGYARDEQVEKARDAGFDMHLVKPVDPATLQRLLAQKK